MGFRWGLFSFFFKESHFPVGKSGTGEGQIWERGVTSALPGWLGRRCGILHFTKAGAQIPGGTRLVSRATAPSCVSNSEKFASPVGASALSAKMKRAPKLRIVHLTW